MMRIPRVMLLAGVGVGGWLGGIISERYAYKLFGNFDVPSAGDVGHCILHKPGLPIFSTVSAATPISQPPSIPPGKGVSRVSEVKINKQNGAGSTGRKKIYYHMQ